MKKILVVGLLFFAISNVVAQSKFALEESFSNYDIKYEKKSKDCEYKIYIDSIGATKYTLFLIKLPSGNNFKNTHSVLVYNELEKKSTYFFPKEENKTSNLDTISTVVKGLISQNFKPQKDITLLDKNLNSQILSQANSKILDLVNKNYKKFAFSLHPFSLKGQNYNEAGQKLQDDFLQSKINLTYLKGKPVVTSQIINHNQQIECLMKWELDVKADNQNQKLVWNILATSIDDGKNWFFTEFGNKEGLEILANDKFIKLNKIIISKITLNSFK